MVPLFSISLQREWKELPSYGLIGNAVYGEEVTNLLKLS